MTDIRLTDLSYGHLGKVSYDTKDSQWSFSVTAQREPLIQQLLPFKEFATPSIHKKRMDSEQPSVAFPAQLKTLLKAQPELCPASEVLDTFAKASLRTPETPRFGALFAVGHAIDTKCISGSRKPLIFATPCGAAGHVLRLLRPRQEIRTWGKGRRPRLSVLDGPFLEEGFWSNTAGGIFQITFSDAQTELSTWLAVRQASMITIFRPLYGRIFTQPGLLDASLDSLESSLLNPNPVATLTTGDFFTGYFVDFSFNPWYSRQFAVIDSRGRWIICNLERPHRRTLIEKIVRKIVGEAYDNYDAVATSRMPRPGQADGWYRILWISDINTIAICSRHDLLLFDIKIEPERLHSPSHIGKSERILDIRRCTSHPTRLFVLTSIRLYWIEVVPARENYGDKNVFAGAKVVFSYRHFRDPGDEMMKLLPMKDNKISVMIMSPKLPLLNVYCFWSGAESSGTPCSSQSSFNLVLAPELETSINTGVFTICPLDSTISARGVSKLGSNYAEQGITFHQLWLLTSSFRLMSTLCGVKPPHFVLSRLSNLRIKPPDKVALKSRHRLSTRATDDSFIVPDGMYQEEPLIPHPSRELGRDYIPELKGSQREDLRLRLNWREIFLQISVAESHERATGDSKIGLADTFGIVESFAGLSRRIQERLDNKYLALSSIYELSDLNLIHTNLEESVIAFEEFVSFLQSVQSLDASSALAVSDIGTSPSVSLPWNVVSNTPDLLKILHQLIEYWMSTLPRDVTNRARGARFKIIRQLALDLCFSSLGISVRNQASSILNTLQPGHDNDQRPDKSGSSSRGGSPGFFSSQVTVMQEQEDDHSLPIPSNTLSEYSQTTSRSELKEDSAISRLRQYVVSIKAKPDFDKPALLNHWPIVPGSDPDLYSYEAAQKAAAKADSGDEGSYKYRHEVARGRRKTERFLRQERARAAELDSQRAYLYQSTASQPKTLHNTFGSQTVGDMPVTQSDRSAFGNRPVQKSKKSKKQRTAGF